MTHRTLFSAYAAATLAVLGALAACDGKPAEPQTTRIIPPAAPYLAPIARAAEPPPAPAPPAIRAEPEPAPSPEEIRAFERRVPK